MKNLKKVNTEFIIIKNSKIHYRGVFAKKNIPKGTQIIEYVGEKITKKEADRRAEKQLDKSKNHSVDGGVYIFELNKKYDIDGNVSWNPARYINHSCNPNCETESDEESIWIVALRDIKKGEELSYNYGYDLSNYEEHPCLCGSKNCVGYIVDESKWDKLKKKISGKK